MTRARGDCCCCWRLFAGAAAVVPVDKTHLVSQWLDWEASALRPGAYSGDAAAALEELAGAMAGRTYLVGDALTLADVSRSSRGGSNGGSGMLYWGCRGMPLLCACTPCAACATITGPVRN